MTDERGNVMTFRTISGDWMERLERAAAVEFGGSASATEYTLTVAQARSGGIVPNTVSLAIRIGRAVAEAERSPVDALLTDVGGYRLISGKISDVERRTTSGFVRGSVSSRASATTQAAWPGSSCRTRT